MVVPGVPARSESRGVAASPRRARLTRRCTRVPGPGETQVSAPPTRQKLDVPGIYADTLSAVPDTLDGQQPLPVVQGLSGYAGRAGKRGRVARARLSVGPQPPDLDHSGTPPRHVVVQSHRHHPATASAAAHTHEGLHDGQLRRLDRERDRAHCTAGLLGHNALQPRHQLLTHRNADPPHLRPCQ